MTTAHTVSPTAAVFNVLAGYWTARVVYVAAKLGIPDLVADGPRTAAELAARTNTHAPSLHRLLRALASTGWIVEQPDGRFMATPLTAGLQSSVPGSLRNFAITELGEEHYPAWGDLLETVRSGELAFDRVFGMPNWQYWGQQEEQAQIFNRAMSEVTAVLEPALLDVLDLSGAHRIVDVGGGRGTLMAALLRSYPKATGVVFDLPHVIELGRQHIADAGMTSRCELIAGDFFETVPAGGDAYLLKWVLHDWDDARSVAILKNCRRAMGSAGRLLVIEAVIPEGNAPFLHKLIDINMLVMTGGRERTEAEYAGLFQAAGFELRSIRATPLEAAVLEARPV
jgi:ubiquinone/menaquinone biosynthesis C-methylase UbiE